MTKENGSLALDGYAKGRMVGDQLPAFALNLTVADAMFHYPDLPKSAENIAIDLHVKNPGGSEDNTIVDLNQFHVELATATVVDLAIFGVSRGSERSLCQTAAETKLVWWYAVLGKVLFAERTDYL